MSGGSFNYLYIADDIQELAEHIYDLERMRDALVGLGYADDVAKLTDELLFEVRRIDLVIETRIKSLRPIWKEMEWWRSCDSSEETFKKVLEEWRGTPNE